LKHSIAAQKIGIVTRITEQLADLQSRIHSATALAGREKDSVRILAVSKKHPPKAVTEAHQAGLCHFGENYLQEALGKIGQVDGGLIWHFIGKIQANKTRPIAEHFAWVHTVSSGRVAKRLSAQRPADMDDLQVCIQVCPLNAPDRSGIAAAELPELADIIQDLPRLRLRGLMMIPLPDETDERSRLEYARTRELLYELQQRGHELDTLSMGMSVDLEAAIMEGSTILRIGTALFGPRNYEQ